MDSIFEFDGQKSCAACPRKKIDAGELSRPLGISCPKPVLHMTLMLTGYNHEPFQVTLAGFLAKTIDIAGPMPCHIGTS